MDNTPLEEIIARLRQLEEPELAKSQLTQGKPADSIFLTANRAGFISIARAFLDAAVCPIEPNDCRSKPIWLHEKLDQMIASDDDRILGFFMRMETWPEPNEYIEARKRQAKRNDRIALFGCAALAIALIVIIAGLTSLFTWFGV